ncbi:MAG: hypothetical protein WC829_18695 [Hyphomicrobium sp.]|jgi:hypothetical protein
MSEGTVTASSSVALIASPGAYASSITNRDGLDLRVGLIEGNAAADHILRPSATPKGIDERGCVIRLNDNEDDEYELKGSEVLSIEGG